MLDPDQQEAASSDPCRPLLILAHAGTGKTRTLVERLLLLQRAKQAGRFGHRSAGMVTALTFTRNATHELRDRLQARGSDSGALDGYTVRTFHALGLDLYRGGWARDYDNRPHIRVATSSQAQVAATEAMRVVGLDRSPLQAVRLIAEAKLGLPVRDADSTLINAALRLHDDLLATRDLIHVHDMLVRPVQLLGEVPALQRDLHARTACVVADEAQDWSPYQAALFSYLAGPDGYATACGDPRQAIFGGSSPHFLLELPLVYPQARIVTLRTTYRLTGPLLALSSAIAARLPGGAVPGRAHRPSGPLPIVHLACSRAEEAAWIANYVSGLRRRGELTRWDEAVVLVRTRAQGAGFATALRAAGLPTRRTTVASLSQRPGVAALVAWLTLLRDPDDQVALLHALDAPPRGQQRTPPRSLRLALVATGPWTIARLLRERPAQLSDWQQRELAAFLRLYSGLRALAQFEEATVVFDAVRARSGVGEWLRANGYDDVNDLATLRALVAEAGDVGVLRHLLSEEVAADEAVADAVLVGTIHGFKGQEARAVVVAGVEEGSIPHPAVLRAGNAGLDDEVRAFYVACTRALEHEAITATWGPSPALESSGPSRLFHLLDPALIRVA